jgi:hypothetical protein
MYRNRTYKKWFNVTLFALKIICLRKLLVFLTYDLDPDPPSVLKLDPDPKTWHLISEADANQNQRKIINRGRIPLTFHPS